MQELTVTFVGGLLVTNEKCRMCGSALGHGILAVDNVPLLPGRMTLAKCESCGSAQFMGDNPVIGYDFEGFEQDYWLNYVQSGAGITAMLHPLLALSTSGRGSLLDIGCGFGFVPHFWQMSGRGRATGLEVSRYGRIGREKLQTEILHEYYSAAESLKGVSFDFVYASEVIEHVPDPEAFVREISAALAPGGVLILTTPDAAAADAATEHHTLLGVLSPGFHFFLASRNALADLLKRCGFAHVRVDAKHGRLFAWASYQPLPAINRRFEAWDAYFAYLETLSSNEDGHVACGALYRWMKDAINTGRLQSAVKAAELFTERTKATYGLSLLQPEPVVDAFLQTKALDNARFPAWLGSALLFYGKTLAEAGHPAERLIHVLDASIQAMRHEIKIGAKFAQEPAAFLPVALNLRSKLVSGLEKAGRSPKAHELAVRMIRPPTASLAAREAALLVGYAPDGVPSSALLQIAEGFAGDGLEHHVCLIVRDGNVEVDPSVVPGAASLSSRPNDSFDFGAWAAMLAGLPGAFEASRLVFANDSCVVANPSGFKNLLSRMAKETADLTALTESHDKVYHTQSYFFQMRGGLLADPMMVAFWRGIPQKASKEEIILSCECALHSLVMNSQGRSVAVLFGDKELFGDAADLTGMDFNPTHSFWERLLLRGFPFIKADLLYSNPHRLDIVHWPFAVKELGGDPQRIAQHLSEMSRARGAAATNLPAKATNLPAKATNLPAKATRLGGLTLFLLGPALSSRLRLRLREMRNGRRLKRAIAATGK
jgi:SAM-dependent methyltransferase